MSERLHGGLGGGTGGGRARDQPGSEGREGGGADETRAAAEELTPGLVADVIFKKVHTIYLFRTSSRFIN